MINDSQTIDTATIKQFVCGVLGCACPDTVFEHIDIRLEFPGVGASDVRLRIGGRLLVRIVAPVDARQVATDLARWLAEGVAERDAAGLNRFRLVLGCDDAGSLAPLARGTFDRIGLRDDRTHLHVLNRVALADLGLAARQ